MWPFGKVKDACVFRDSECYPLWVFILTQVPSSTPSTLPSVSAIPSLVPSSEPSEKPSAWPSKDPSGTPSVDPSHKPSPSGGMIEEVFVQVSMRVLHDQDGSYCGDKKNCWTGISDNVVLVIPKPIHYNPANAKTYFENAKNTRIGSGRTNDDGVGVIRLSSTCEKCIALSCYEDVCSADEVKKNKKVNIRFAKNNKKGELTPLTSKRERRNNQRGEVARTLEEVDAPIDVDEELEMDLVIMYPSYMPWHYAMEEYVMIFETNSSWSIDICLHAPSGFNVSAVLNQDDEKLAESECVFLMVEGIPEVIVFDVEEETAAENQNMRKLVDSNVHPDVQIDLSVENGGVVREIHFDVTGVSGNDE